MNNKIILGQVAEIRETSDIQEVAQTLSSGNWFAYCATDGDPVTFCLVRLKSENDQGGQPCKTFC